MASRLDNYFPGLWDSPILNGTYVKNNRRKSRDAPMNLPKLALEDRDDSISDAELREYFRGLK